jgi:hypothetical protein
MLKEFLIASGVKPSDLAEAVRESRRVVRGIERWADVVRQGAHNVGEHTDSPKIKKGALIVAIAAETVTQKARQMNGRGKR